MAETIETFADLVRVTRSQLERQRFLLVFLRAELPEDARADQVERFASRQGGALAPVMYADKGIFELHDFDDLVMDAQRTMDHLGQGQGDDMRWDIVLVGCLVGSTLAEPTEQAVDDALQDILRAVRTGRSLGHLAAFDRDGTPVSFQ